MSTATLLRVFILAELVTSLLAMYVDFALASSLPAPLQTYLLTRSRGPFDFGDVFALSVIVPLFVALVVAWIGLWMLKRWARVLYTALVVVSLVVTLFVGPIVTSALGAMLYSASSLAAGVILGIIWLSELRTSFGSPA